MDTKTNNSPLISIIVPVYNVEQFLPKCIDSLINQTFKDIEIICVNDGSKDNSLKILEEYKRKDSRIKVINNKNQGPGLSRQCGLNNVDPASKYLMFCDSDDWYEPDMCEKMYNAIEQQNVDIVMCDTNVHIIENDNNQGRLNGCIGHRKIRITGKSEINTKTISQISTLLFNKILKLDIIKKYGIAFPDAKMHDDSTFISQYLLVSNNYYGIDEKLYNYAYRKNSLVFNACSNKDKKLLYPSINCIQTLHNFVTKNDSLTFNTNYILQKFWDFLYYDYCHLDKSQKITLLKKAHSVLNNVSYLKEDRPILFMLKKGKIYQVASQLEDKIFLSPLQKLFSIKNKKDYKQITIAGIKIKKKLYRSSSEVNNRSKNICYSDSITNRELLLSKLNILSTAYKAAISKQQKANIVLQIYELFTGKNPVAYPYKGNIDKKDVVLISPPYWDIYTPFSAIPCIIAELNKVGEKSQNIDLGILTFHKDFDELWKSKAQWLLSENFYNNDVAVLKNKIVSNYNEYLATVSFLSDDDFDIVKLKEIYPKLNSFQRGVLDKLFYMIMQERIVHPSLNSDFDLENDVLKQNINNLLKAIADFGLIEDFLNIPDIVGISVTSLDQLTMGCFITQIIRSINPNVQIIMGGSAVDIIRRTTDENVAKLFKYFDYLIIGEGETSARKLIKAIKNNKEDLSDIENLIYYQNGKLRFNEEIIECTENLNPPDYDGIDFSMYMAAEPMLSYQTSRGCFYGNCAFCNHDKKYRHNYRKKSISKVINDLRFLHEKYNIKHFQFVDEAIEPRYFAEFLNEFEKTELSKEIEWIYYSRVSPFYNEEIVKKAKKCGCRMVMFGVETFNQRLLNHIKKGIVAKQSIENLKLFHQNGIKTHAWLMSILPSETKDEIRYDVEMIKQYKDYIDVMAMGRFYLDTSTDMYANPQKFNIVKVNPCDGYDFISTYENKIINKKELNLIVDNEYYPTLKSLCFSNNRYVAYFDVSEQKENLIMK